MAMSWVAEAMAMAKPIPTTAARLAVGSTRLQSTRQATITTCSVTIQARRCPSRPVSQGIRMRSMRGAQRKLIA